MKRIFLLFFLYGLPSSAAIFNYDYWAPRQLQKYFDKVLKAAGSAPESQCRSAYDSFLEDGVLDITYSLGYFDASTGGVRHLYHGTDYGYSPSLDIEFFHVIRKHFTQACQNRRQVSCEFQQSGDPDSGRVVLEKTTSIHGKPTLIRISLTYASASELYEDNKNSLKDRQQFLALQSEDNFFNSVGQADIVFYNGHSRNGGGPDFNPPVLLSNKKVDFDGYYLKLKPGITRLLQHLDDRSRDDSVVGLFSCFSHKHFFKSITAVHPHQKLIMSMDDTNYYDSLFASMGYLEGFMRGHCGTSLSRMARQVDSVRRGYSDFNL